MVFHVSEEYFTFQNFRKDNIFHTVHDYANNNILWLGTEKLMPLKRVSAEELCLLFSELENVELDFYYPT